MSGSPEWGRPRRRSDQGTALVEFAMVVVLFAFICYALVAFGLAMNLKSNLTHAASEGARAAIGAGGQCDLTTSACTDQKRQAAIDRVKESVSGQSTEVRQQVADQLAVADNVKIADCSDFSTDGYTEAGATCIRVAIPYDYGTHPIVPSAPGLGVILPSTLEASGVVQLSN